MGAVALLARRQVRAHGARGALTAAGVALGVALVVAIRVINASTLAGFTEAIEDLAGTAALQVRGPGPFSETIADRLRALPEVDHAVPIVTATFFAVDPPAAGEALAVFAADVTDGHAIKTLHLVKAADRVVDDPLSFLVDPTSIILTDTFAARLGIGRNAQLRLRTPAGLRSFTVRGILPPGGVGRAYGGNLLLMDVVGAQVVLGRDRMVDEVDVTLRPGVAVDDATRAIDAALASTPGLEAVPPARRGEQIERYLRSYRTLLSGISGLALLAAIFVAGSAVGTSVAARRREIGLLRCVGYQRWWNDHAVNRFHVTLAPGADAEAVRRAIAGVGAVEGLKVLTQRELYAYHQDAVGRAFRFTRALEVLPLIVAGLGLAEALIAVSLDRRREFALLRAAGATRGQIARSVVGEATGVGFLGLAGGLVMGAALAVLWVRITFAYQLGWDVDLHVSIASLPAAAVAAFLVSIPAGVLPARWIARLPVVEALREG